jgi:hypothetical protein
VRPPHLGTARQPDRLQASTRFRHWSLGDLRGFERTSFKLVQLVPAAHQAWHWTRKSCWGLVPDPATSSAPRRQLPTMSTRVCQDPRTPACSTYEDAVLTSPPRCSANKSNQPVQLSSDDYLFQFTLECCEPCRFQGRRLNLERWSCPRRGATSPWRTRRMMHDALRPCTKIVEPQESAPGK